jgi:ABC-2 type transport system permease protein
MGAWANIKAIVKRELGGYFTSPIAYVFLVIYLLLAGFFTFTVGNFFERGEASLVSFFTWHPWLYLFLVPAVGMRLWSEERRLGTLELLLTMPVTTWQAIIGKFLASWLFLALALALTFPVIITVNWLGSPDNGVIFAGYTPVTDLLVRFASPRVVEVVAAFSVMTHFEGFQRGVLDVRDFVFFLSVIGFALFTTGVIIRNHRAG